MISEEGMSEELKSAVIKTLESVHGSIKDAQEVTKKVLGELTQSKTKEVAIMAMGFAIGQFFDCVETCSGKRETDWVLEGIAHSVNALLAQTENGGKMRIEMRIVRRGNQA